MSALFMRNYSQDKAVYDNDLSYGEYFIYLILMLFIKLLQKNKLVETCK